MCWQWSTNALLCQVICKPDLDEAFPQLLRALDATNTTAVYVGSDDSSIRDNLSRAFKAIGR